MSQIDTLLCNDFRTVNSTIARIKKIQELLDESSYIKQEQERLPRWRRFIHFWVLVVNSFIRNRGPVRAASLAYTTLLALVPVLALVVSITTGFLEKDDGRTINLLLDKFIVTVAPQLNLIQEGDDEEAALNRAEIVNRIRGFIEKTNSGTLGVTAGVFLFLIAIMLLSTVESTFNDMWGVTRGRTWLNRIIQYWATITLGPIFIATAVGLTTGAQIQSAKAERAQEVQEQDVQPPQLISADSPRRTATPRSGFKARVEAASQWLLQTPVLGVVILELLPFVVLSTFLMLFYRMMPATKVRWNAALMGGIVGGCLLQLNNIFNVVYITRVDTYRSIYGGLGVVPIFLIGLYFSWLIILFGAQVAYAFQNKAAYVQEKQAEAINQRGREFAALRLMTLIAQHFDKGEKPPTRLIMSNTLGVPSQLACTVLSCLVSGKLLIEVSGEETGYVPARPLDKITIEDILSALRGGQGTELATLDDPARVLVREEYERIVLAEMHAAGSVTLENLVQRVETFATTRAVPGELATQPANA